MFKSSTQEHSMAAAKPASLRNYQFSHNEMQPAEDNLS